MQYKSITYKQTKNLGNYESKTLELSVSLDPEDDHEDVTIALKEEVRRLLDREYEPMEDELEF